jgi:ketosteroid isomerase-like protein
MAARAWRLCPAFQGVNAETREETMRTMACSSLMAGVASAVFLFGSGMVAAQDADLQAQVEDFQQRFEGAIAADDWETIGSLFTENAVYQPFTGGMVEGRAEIQSTLEQNPAEAIDIRSSRVEMLGENMLFDIGTFTLTLPEEAGGTFEGEYVSLSEMGENGPQIRSLTTFPLRQAPGTADQQ